MGDETERHETERHDTEGDVDVHIGEPIRLYDAVAPGSESWVNDERAYFSTTFATDVVTNVVVPTITPVVPEHPTGASVIVAPGGGFHALSINSEGFDVARWVARRGVTAFVLKYRLVPSGDDGAAELAEKAVADPALVDRDMRRIAPLAAADGEAAVRLVRDRADELDVSPDQVGFVGFSAGGNVAVRVGYSDDDRARPDFLAPVYATLLGEEPADPPARSGPMFVVAATDDPLGLAADSVRIYERWRRAGLSAELHLYARGGHGFGMRRQGSPSDAWIDRFGEWLADSGWARP